MEKSNFDPDATIPRLDPDQTQPPVPREELYPKEGEETFNEMLDRIRKQDDKLKADVAEALRGAFGMEVEIVGDFEEVGDNQFKFTVNFGGETKEVIVKRPEALQG